VDPGLATGSTDRLVIFHGNDAGAHAGQQVWRWPVRHFRGHLTSTRLARHRHRTGAPDSGFAYRLAAIQLPVNTVLAATEVLTRLRKAFDVERHNETKQASQLMASMYAAMDRAYPDEYSSSLRDHEISVTLARILFLLFGDDTDMWQPDGFRDYLLQHTGPDGVNLQSRLQELFNGLNDPAGAVAAALPYINGGIFRENITLPAIGPDFRNAILDACIVDWSTISPAVFGSMFQSVRDARTRRELGEHYTSEENILKTLNPLFLDDLRAELERTKTMKNEVLALNRLWERLGDVRYMDPACGCGNFIIIAYRELRDLELRIMERLQDISGSTQLGFDPSLALKVTLDHFYGIEIDEWPAKIAETAMFLIDRQSDLKLKERFGESPKRLPIQCQSRIVVGNALLLDWAHVCPPSQNVIIAGNPPFIGARLKTPSQGRDLEVAWGSDYNSDFDYVTGWHAKAMAYYAAREGVWALVATNSICQGTSTPPLFRPIRRNGWQIKFAHRSFAWTSEAAGKAAVHCVIIGFTRDAVKPRLFDYKSPQSPAVEVPVSQVNAYLVDAPWVLVDRRNSLLSPALTPCDFGSMPNDGRGNLLVEPANYLEVVADPIAAQYLRRFQGSDELINGRDRWCLWMVGASKSDIQNSSILRQRVAAVRKARLASKRAATSKLAATPQLFGERRQPTQSYIGIPRHVSESRRYFTVARFQSDVICGDANFAAADVDGMLFAVISSSMFITWQRTIGGRVKSDLRFSNTVVWNTLPLALVDKETRKLIIAAGDDVLRARERHPERSLAQHYSSETMDPALVEAHDRLDAVVDRAFGAKATCATERERQQILFAKYKSMVIANA